MMDLFFPNYNFRFINDLQDIVDMGVSLSEVPTNFRKN